MTDANEATPHITLLVLCSPCEVLNPSALVLSHALMCTWCTTTGSTFCASCLVAAKPVKNVASSTPPTVAHRVVTSQHQVPFKDVHDIDRSGF